MNEHYYESSFDLTNLLKGSPESPCDHRACFDKTAVQHNCTADEKTEARKVQVASSRVQSQQMNEVGFSLGGSAEALLFNSTLTIKHLFRLSLYFISVVCHLCPCLSQRLSYLSFHSVSLSSLSYTTQAVLFLPSLQLLSPVTTSSS